MEPINLGPRPFRFTDPRQERIYRRLALVGPGPASFYQDACRVVTGSTPLESATHIVAHLLREIESAIRDVLLPADEHPKKMDHADEIRAILISLDVPESDPIAKSWLGLAGRGNDYGLATRAHREALTSPRPFDQEFRRFWAEIEAVLDYVLGRFESHYLDYHRRIDRILDGASPNRQIVQDLRQHIPNNRVALAYLFGKIDTPDWLGPLKTGGYFTRPPQAEHNEAEGTVRYPPWPESRFLARMTSLAPEQVVDIMLGIPPTDNVSVHIDIVDAALVVPPSLAVRFVPMITSWFEPPYNFLLPHKLGELIARLAQEGAGVETLSLAKKVLEIQPREKTPNRQLQATYVREWDYGDILRRFVPSVVTSLGEPAFLLLCELLANAMAEFVESESEGEPFEDYSFIWRNDIGQHEQYQQDDLRNALVTSVRDAALNLIDQQGCDAAAIIKSLESFGWRVFKRIALHVLAAAEADVGDLVSERLTEKARFDDSRSMREYSLLAQAYFKDLEDSQKQEILGWIEKGPDIEKYRASHKAATGEPIDTIREEHYIKIWQRDSLAMLQPGLPDEWGKRHEELVEELGPAETTHFSLSTDVMRGPNLSSIGAANLHAMSTEHLVSFLKSWEPSSGFMEPEYEDVGRELATIVASDLARFVAEAERFRGLRPEFIGGIITGVRDAINADHAQPLPWEAILELCQWVIEDSRDSENNGDTEGNRPWSWARKGIADLLIRGLTNTEAQVPFSLRAHIWGIIQGLTTDPDPSTENEADFTGLGAYGVSINTVRGQAMHAVIHYALWVVRNLRSVETETTTSFDLVPEVREILNTHLDTSLDSSPAIRAVYGRFFPWLVFLDPAWATESFRKIFPNQGEATSLRDAAWTTYLAMCPIYDNVFQILADEYTRAVARATTSNNEEGFSREDPNIALAEHVMVLYMRGIISLEPGGLISTFFSQAPGNVRNHAISFVGRSLKEMEGTVNAEMISRLIEFWSKRLAAAKGASPTESATELSAFAWWFTSEKFEDPWAITQLIEALQLGSVMEIDHQVVERLALLAYSFPREVVDALNLMVEGDREGWHIDLWGGHLRLALKRVLDSDQEEARQGAAALIHRLAGRGYLDFGDLLPDASQSI